LMPRGSEVAIRDRALRLVRRATVSVICSVVALTGVFSTAAALTFSGKAAAHHEAPPVIPSAAPPVQKARPAPIVVTKVVHVPYGSYAAYSTGTKSTGGSAAQPPAQGPAAAPPPPPPAACVSTPSKPC